MQQLLPGILAQITEPVELIWQQVLANAFVFAIAIGGIMLWSRWLRGWWKNETAAQPTCFQPQATRTPVIPRPPILLGNLWITINLVFSIMATIELKEPLTEFPDLQGLTIQLVVFPLFIGAVLIGLWEFFDHENGLVEYFMTKDWQQDLQIGAEVFLLAMPWTLILMMTSLLWRQPNDQHLLLRMLQSQTDFPTLLIIMLGVVISAPLIEELLFRVLLQGGIMQTTRFPKFAVVFAVAAIFSLVHGPHDALQLMPLSLCLGYCMAQQQRFWAVVTAHALFNTFMLTTLLLTMSA